MAAKTDVIKITKSSQITQAAAHGAEAITAGKLVGFATETVYGIAALATDTAAMERLRELKSRPKRPFSVHLGQPEDVARYVKKIPPDARRIIEKGWPGPITLILPAGGKLADRKPQSAGMYDVLCHEDLIGLRCPAAPLAMAMLSAVDGPVVAPSANAKGAASPRSGRDVLASLNGKIDLLFDEGRTALGRDSTIVLFDADDCWKIVRKGAVDERALRRLLRRKILFVCTGNTCRSPMAEGLAKKMLADALDCRVRDLPSRGWEVESAGTMSFGGEPPSSEAVRAARRLGADISRYRSQKLTSELIHEADMIFCMAAHHADEVRRRVPAAADKVKRLARGDVPDPIGGGADMYRKTAEKIKQALNVIVDKVLQ